MKSKHFFWPVLAWLAIASFPALPWMSGIGLDASWIWGLNLAARDHLLFGRDIAFTYGPLGYLNQPIVPLTSAGPFIAYSLGMYAVWLYVLYRVRDHKVFAVFAAFCYVSLAIWLWDIYEAVLIGLAVCAVIRRRDPVPVAVLAMMTGVAPLLRLHQLIAGGALLLFVLFYQRERRNYWLMPVIGGVSFAVLWKASGQQFQYVLPWLRSSWEIVNGYTEAMASPGPMWQVGLGLGSLIGAVGLALWIYPAAAVPVGLTGFLIFKHAFVRQDAHAAPFHFKMAAVSLLLWALALEVTKKERAAKGFAVAMLALGFAVGAPLFPYINENLHDRLTLRYPRYFIPGYWNFGEFAAARAEQRKGEMSPSVLDSGSRAAIGNATVDVFPNQIDVVGASELWWRPRPVFQSYSAYTPYLDGLNAASYRERGPAKVLVHWQPIDGRHMMFDDPLTWREALRQYEFEREASLGGERWGLLLKRKDAPPDGFETVDSREITTGWDEWVDVPRRGDRESELVTISASIEPSLQGKLMRQALRGAVVRIEVQYEDGMRAPFRVVRANLVSGPVISPLPRNLEELRPLFSREWTRVPDVARMRLQTDSPQRFEAGLRIRFERLRRIYPRGMGS